MRYHGRMKYLLPCLALCAGCAKQSIPDEVKAEPVRQRPSVEVPRSRAPQNVPVRDAQKPPATYPIGKYVYGEPYTTDQLRALAGRAGERMIKDALASEQGRSVVEMLLQNPNNDAGRMIGQPKIRARALDPEIEFKYVEKESLWYALVPVMTNLEADFEWGTHRREFKLPAMMWLGEQEGKAVWHEVKVEMQSSPPNQSNGEVFEFGKPPGW